MIKLPRSVLIKRKKISYIDIHLFCDGSLTRVCIVPYAVINQQNIFIKNLITSKLRLARKDLFIPCLELLAAHMSANLPENAKLILIN